tara:strand:+ start:2791 stop:3207 length:417 start_codon:yes stop_codon:yes gene_type:complete
MKLTKFIFLIFSIVLLSCSQKTLTINSSVKRINYPGVVGLSPFIGYKISFENSSDFKIEKVQLNNDTKIKEFSLYNESTKKSISSANLLSKGKYMISFRSQNIKGVEKPEEVTIFILSKGKIEKKTAKVLIKKPFSLR